MSFFTLVDAGSDRDFPGATGLAHMFEHMAFKGTERIGTTDFAKESVALQIEEDAYLAYDRERHKNVGRDENKIAELQKAWKAASESAERFVTTNEFSQIVKEHGGVDLNAFTTSEETGYLYSFPSNEIELWAYLESERLLHPVLREFYSEREVVHEERRAAESQPLGRLLEQLLATAYEVHPYRQPVVGWPSDLDSFSRTDALAYFRKYYVPANIVIAIVGDIKRNEIMPIVEKYFARLPAKPEPDALHSVEPTQKAEKIVIMHETGQPLFVEAYHKPSATDKDEVVYDALQDLLSSGRTSRLYRSLVSEKKVAAFSMALNDYPGSKYPNLFLFYAVPAPGHTDEEIRNAMHAEIKRVQVEEITQDELDMIKTRTKAKLARGLGSNEGLAQRLAIYQALFGNWRELFVQPLRIDGVSKTDIRRVANMTFVESNRTIAMIEAARDQPTVTGKEQAP